MPIRSCLWCCPTVQVGDRLLPTGRGGAARRRAVGPLTLRRRRSRTIALTADAFVDLGGQRPAFGVHHLMPGPAPVMQGDRFPFVVEHRRARRPLFGVGDIVQDTIGLLSRATRWFSRSTSSLKRPSGCCTTLAISPSMCLSLSSDNGRKPNSVSARSPDLRLPIADQRIVEPVDAVGDEADIRIEEERRRRDGTIERIIFVVELDLEASRRGLRSMTW